MPIVTWDNKFSVGIDEIDKQHQKLILLLNMLYDSMKEGKGKQKLEQILSELVNYTEYHFRFEEDIFEKYSYKDKAFHIKEHNALREKVLNYSKKIQSGEGLITQELLKFLKEWVVNHILTVDKQYSYDIATKIK